MAIRVTVGYDGGEQETIILRPLGLVAAERQFGKSLGEHSIESTLWAAWYLKGKPLGSFDEWLATVEEVVEREEETRPLEPAPSADSSPT